MNAPPYPLPGPVALRGNLVAALGEAAASPLAVRAYRRAWVLAAAGRYGEALATSDEALAAGPLAAAAARATRASVLRQVALHERAEAEDDAGLASLPEHSDEAPRAVVADVAANLAVGRVADAVGVAQLRPGSDQDLDSRLAAARAAVERLRAAGDAPAEAVLCGVPWRQVVRLGWVEGEAALIRGDAAAATRAFAQSHRLAAARGARRHEAKSLLFLAGARAAAGELTTAARLAGQAASLAGNCGAAPLVWPARLILAEAAEARGAHRAAQAQRERAHTIRAKLLASLPDDLREQAHARAVA